MEQSKPTVTQVISGGRRKLHYLFPDKREMVEELDINTNEVLLRKWKYPKEIGNSDWEIEIGQNEKKFNPEQDLMAESGQNPIFLRKDTRDKFEWRIRNLKFPLEVYQLSIDHQKQEIILRTTNKKYFKRFDIPDLKRIKIPLQESSLAYKHQNNTLIISYDKPKVIIDQEQQKLKEVMKMEVQQQEQSNCQQQ